MQAKFDNAAVRLAVLATFAMVSVSLTVGAAESASVDCQKASTTVERTICDDPLLSKLDRELNEIYSQELRIATDPSSFEAEQRNWIRTVRDACQSATCLRTAYERRIYGLKFGSSWMTASRADAICQKVTDAANDGTLAGRFRSFSDDVPSDIAVREQYEKRVYPDGGYGINEVLRLEHRGRIRTLGRVGGGGTCSACEIVDLDGYGSVLDPEDDEEQNLRWAGWGTCDNFLIENDELNLVTTKRSEVRLVSWLGPDRARRPLCLLKPIEDEFTAVTVTARDEGLCDAVKENGVEVVPWGPAETVTPEEHDRFGQVGLDKRSAAIDLNADGEVDRIQLFH